MDSKLRTFIAVELEASLQQSLQNIQNNLKPLNLDINWVKPGNIHITLKFLGDITPDEIKAISETLPKIFGAVRPFEITLAGLGVFPQIQQPNVLWVGIEEGAQEIKKLAAVLEETLGRLGFPNERREFMAHLTLGRFRSLKNCGVLEKAIKNYSPKEPVRQTVNKIIFFKSTLSVSGSIYKPLAGADLTA